MTIKRYTEIKKDKKEHMYENQEIHRDQKEQKEQMYDNQEIHRDKKEKNPPNNELHV